MKTLSRTRIHAYYLKSNLPRENFGFSIHHSIGENGITWMEKNEDITTPVNPRITFTTIEKWFLDYLGYDIRVLPDEISIHLWLTFPQQKLRTISSGKIFHDDLGLAPIRNRFSPYFNEKIWLILLVSGWTRIAQEEPFMARCGDVGDELGSRIIASRQVQELMRLCFIMEKVYWPYSKWFGTAFSKLQCFFQLGPVFNKIFESSTWKEREKNFSEAYHIVAEIHNSLGITPQIDTAVSLFHDRPYYIIHANHFSDAIMTVLENKYGKMEKTHVVLGSVDQWSSCTDLSESNILLSKAQQVYL